MEDKGYVLRTEIGIFPVDISVSKEKFNEVLSKISRFYEIYKPDTMYDNIPVTEYYYEREQVLYPIGMVFHRDKIKW